MGINPAADLCAAVVLALMERAMTPREPSEAIQCKKCNDTGQVAIRARDGQYAFAGPVPDDARGYADADCWFCDCGRPPVRAAYAVDATEGRDG